MAINWASGVDVQGKKFWHPTENIAVSPFIISAEIGCYSGYLLSPSVPSWQDVNIRECWYMTSSVKLSEMKAQLAERLVILRQLKSDLAEIDLDQFVVSWQLRPEIKLRGSWGKVAWFSIKNSFRIGSVQYHLTCSSGKGKGIQRYSDDSLLALLHLAESRVKVSWSLPYLADLLAKSAVDPTKNLTGLG